MSTVVNIRILSSAQIILLVAVVGCQNSSSPVGVTTNEQAGSVNPPASADNTPALVPNVQESSDDSPAQTTSTGQSEAEPTELAAAAKVPDLPVVPATPTVPATPETPTEQPAAESLGIGDPAPPLSISQWMTGDPVDQLESGQVYVVEFWATWCGPCLASMPHISELQTHYGDKVRFIGVTRETEDVVQRFLGKEQSDGKTWKEVITYRLARDQDDAMNTAYMQAAGQSGIPTAFIVGRDGVVEWIGHPMAIEEPLAKVVAGDWDRAAAVAEFEQQQKLKEMQRELSQLVRSQDWDQALALLDETESTMGPSAGLTQTRLAVLQRAGKSEEAAAVRAALVKQSWDDAQMLNEIAWGIAIGRGERDLDLALRTAARAAELTNHADASILDTLARVYYEQGKLKEAVEWQTKAVEHDSANPQITAAFKKYEAELAEQGSADQPAAGEKDPTAGENATPPEKAGSPATP
jgi:thiol-disulfide isomerase/thioredoxin